MRQLNETDQRILDAARELFSQNGVEHTEMKDIAARLGISRSTLYRHFPGRDTILFLLAQQALDMLSTEILHSARNTRNGYERFSAQLQALCRALLAHPQEVHFLRDFDYIFTKEYPAEEGRRFKGYLEREDSETPMLESYRLGQRDGSIRPSPDPACDVITLCNACYAMAQRILPRREHYLAEHGYAEEMLIRHAELLLQAIRMN